MNNQSIGNGCATVTNIGGNFSSGTSITTYDPYGSPVLISAQVYPDRVEHVYRRESNTTLTTWPCRQSDPEIYKIVITWKDGQTSCVKVMGKYVPACPESYNFDGEETID